MKKKKKKIKPKLPDINAALLYHRNNSIEYSRKYMESLIRLNNLLPDEYKIKLKTWAKDALIEIERQIGKYRSDYNNSNT